jgi:hypothetical protein
MKKTLYLIALAILIHNAYTLSMATAAEARVRILELQEINPSCKSFFDHAIAQTLQEFYKQNGCTNMWEMRKYHGYDELDRLLSIAYRKAWESYQAMLVKEQAKQAAKYYNW